MNELLQLKGQFQSSKNSSKPGAANLPSGAYVKSEKVVALKKDLENVVAFWNKETLLTGALVNVQYIRTVAKSNRLQNILTDGAKKPNDSIVGAKFTEDNTKKHIITHYVKRTALQTSIEKLKKCIEILDTEFQGEITSEKLDAVNNDAIKLSSTALTKSSFAAIVVDAFYAEGFDVQRNVNDMNDDAIITIYETDESIDVLLKKIGLTTYTGRLNDTTVRLLPDEYSLLKRNAPYLIAMATTDLSDYSGADFTPSSKALHNIITIPSPENEPTIGVIDTLFSKNVYFTEWVEYTKKIDEEIEIVPEDYFHGTAVSSIIVDGPASNPKLDDGCGRFRVRHFGVAKSGRFSSYSILQSIRDIISLNRDIKVWNLSLGSSLEINPNFISPEAAELDRIQFENDVIFVIAGTNKTEAEQNRIGAPADSINALIVNAVTEANTSAPYSREGPVLSFFHKPDLCYYGGDKQNPITVCSPTGEAKVCGTSFAAPWISRKLAYLIHIMGFSREIAKALLIDSAAKWQLDEDPSNVLGYGVVPIRIEDIVQTPNDEIKFIMTGSCKEYNTYTYAIPVPTAKGKHPFIAKATLCYFPKCSRNQGVDYTNTELDLHFGRIDGTTIKTVNDNKQGDKGAHYLYEGSAREQYRKWDNIKFIYEKPKSRAVAKKVYGNGSWGISIKTKERLAKKDGKGLNFGLVITLKEIYGLNRIDEFIQQCSFRGWLVSKLNVENRMDIYTKAEEDITFDVQGNEIK